MKDRQMHKVRYHFRWHMFSYVDLRLAPDMDRQVVDRLLSFLCGRPETLSYQMDRVNNGEQNCWILIIGTSNSRTTQKRIREFFHDRRIQWMDRYLDDEPPYYPY